MYKNIRHKIWRAKIVKKDGQPGKIIDNKFTIACGNKSLEVIEIQKEGKNKLSLKDFLMDLVRNLGRNELSTASAVTKRIYQVWQTNCTTWSRRRSSNEGLVQ